MKEAIKFGFILLIFCSLSAGLLAIVNEITAPVIAANELKRTIKSYEVIFGDKADEFEKYDEKKFKKVKAKYPNIDKIFIAKKKNKIIGYGINVQSNGFGGLMINAIGFLNKGDKIVGFRNISNKETKGFGDKIANKEYYSTYENKSAKGPLQINKNPKKDDEVLQLSGATVTSKGVLVGDNIAIEAFNMIKNQEG